jgi:hypothetical protein
VRPEWSSTPLADSCFAHERVKTFWNEKAQQALGIGHSGLYASGDAFWLDRNNWGALRASRLHCEAQKAMGNHQRMGRR